MLERVLTFFIQAVVVCKRCFGLEGFEVSGLPPRGSRFKGSRFRI